MGKAEDERVPSMWLFQLAALIGAHLTGRIIAPTMLDSSFVSFAAKRHGMGPLLLAASGNSLDAQSRAWLEQSRHALRQRQAIETLLLKVVDACFAQAKIPWLVLKGAPQAQLLYGDSSLRPSGDIDILVPPAMFTKAIEALRGLGWTTAKAKKSAIVPQSLAMRILRDIELQAPGKIPIRMELHQRPLFVEPFGLTGADLFAATQRSPFPAPTMGPTLAYYLFAHGVASAWCRLKWLTDFAQILAKLDDTDANVLLSTAEQRHTQNSLAASISLTNELFTHTASTMLGTWAGSYQKKMSVQRRRDLYWSALMSPDANIGTPLNDRAASLRSQFLFCESLLSRFRLVFMAPASVLVRKASGFSH